MPGGGKKPRTATPLAWRLVYLVVLSVVGWSFLSTRAASAAIATDVAATRDEIKAVHAEVMALRSGYKAALTADSVRPMLEDALEQRLSRVATQISEDMGAHVAKSVAAAVGAATRSELQGAVPTIEAGMRKQLLPQGKQLLALVQLLAELKATPWLMLRAMPPPQWPPPPPRSHWPPRRTLRPHASRPHMHMYMRQCMKRRMRRRMS